MRKVAAALVFMAVHCSLVRAGDLERNAELDLVVAYQVGYLSAGAADDLRNGALYHRKLGVTFARCLAGQSYAATTDTCKGAGSTPGYKATLATYCSTTDNSCNGGSNAGVLASGDLFSACNTLSLAGRTDWRVTSRLEWMTLFNDIFASQPAFALEFDETLADPRVWSSTANANSALTSFSFSLKTFAFESTPKNTAGYALCVAP